MMAPLSQRAAARKIAENPEGVDMPLARPFRASALYRSGGSLWLAPFDGSRQSRLKTSTGGSLGPALWSPDGRLVFYLFFPGDGRANTLRQQTRTPAKTSWWLPPRSTWHSRPTATPAFLWAPAAARRAHTCCCSSDCPGVSWRCASTRPSSPDKYRRYLRPTARKCFSRVTADRKSVV